MAESKRTRQLPRLRFLRGVPPPPPLQHPPLRCCVSSPPHSRRLTDPHLTNGTVHALALVLQVDLDAMLELNGLNYTDALPLNFKLKVGAATNQCPAHSSSALCAHPCSAAHACVGSLNSAAAA